MIRIFFIFFIRDDICFPFDLVTILIIDDNFHIPVVVLLLVLILEPLVNPNVVLVMGAQSMFDDAEFLCKKKPRFVLDEVIVNMKKLILMTNND